MPPVTKAKTSPSETKGKKPVAARVSKHKKKYWRKGTDVSDVIDTSQRLREEKEAGGLVEVRANDDLFTVDRIRTPVSVSKKGKNLTPTAPKQFTRRQQAALDKITEKLEAVNKFGPLTTEATFPKKPKGKLAKLDNKPKVVREKEQPKKVVEVDLWNTNLEPSTGNLCGMARVGAEWYLKVTKQKKPKRPESLNKKPSLLKAVEVPDAGASYNPDAEAYTSYVCEIAKDEMSKIQREETLKKKLALAPGESFATRGDLIQEGLAGLYPEKEPKVDEKTEVAAGEDSFLERGPREIKIKTRQARKREEKEKKEKELKKQQKEANMRESQMFRVKTIAKKVKKFEAEVQEKAKKRKLKKKIDNVTKTKKLGGKFEEAEDPFLLTSELPGSLRELKPQGDILLDRFKSLQKRNMLSTDKYVEKKLPTKLKYKMKENFTHRDIIIGTKLLPNSTTY